MKLTNNQLILGGLIIAGVSALVTYYYVKGQNEPTSGLVTLYGKKKRKVSTTSGQPINLKETGEYTYRCKDKNGVVFLSSKPCAEVNSVRDTSQDK